MDININFLKTFVKLAEIGNYTRTAEKLYMTQPGVSQHVRWLEDYFGEKLLQKNGRSFELTPAGEKVLSYAKNLFKEHQSFIDSMAEDDPYEGLCRLRSPGSFGMVMYGHLLEYNKKHPKLNIEFFYAPNVTIENELLAGKCDVGFMSVRPEDSSLKAVPIDKEKLCLVVPSSLKKTDFQSIVELGFIFHPDGPKMVDELFSANYPKEYKGFESLRVSGGINQITRILEPVAAGLGFTVLPEYACRSYSNPKKIKYVKLKKDIVSTIYAVSKKFKPLPSRFEKIIEGYKRL